MLPCVIDNRHHNLSKACASQRPFCQVIAGLGAPEVSQCRMTDMPSITVLSEGPAVIFGAMPGGRDKHTHADRLKKESSVQ